MNIDERITYLSGRVYQAETEMQRWRTVAIAACVACILMAVALGVRAGGAL
jgi:hypothetical protein